MPNLLPGTLRLVSADGLALEVAAGTALPVRRHAVHRTAFESKSWSIELSYRTAEGAPHERRLPLLTWDGASPAGRELAISVWVSPHRAAFVEVELDGGRELYRFEPVPLRDASGRVAVAAAAPGATVVERGFASAATAPPPNLRIVTTCDACSKPFSMRVTHAGLAGLDVFYCDRCPNVTSVPLTDPRSIGFWKGIESRRLDLTDDPKGVPARAVEDNLTVYAAFERALAPCGCGGAKRFLADLRCPHCRASHTSFKGDLWTRLSEVYLCHVSGAEHLTGDIAWRR